MVGVTHPYRQGLEKAERAGEVVATSHEVCCELFWKFLRWREEDGKKLGLLV